MPSTNPESEEADRQARFTVAKLALWAGDYLTAEENLRAVAGPARRRGTPRPSSFEDPTAASAIRSLNQLRRRREEYRTLALSAELPQALIHPRPSLRSVGTHLAGVIWPESEREYELRCYVQDLTWEKEFYRMAARLSGDEAAAGRVHDLGYGSSDPRDLGPPAAADEEAVAALDIAWGFTVGPLELHAEVSDFCTCTVRGMWVEPGLPASVDDVVSIYQKFLDTFDPAP
jgi:hypothetical protein